MNAGRELDALVAEKVDGLEVAWGETWTFEDWNGSAGRTEKHGPGVPKNGHDSSIVPPLEAVPWYSTSHEAAWSMVERMHGHLLALEQHRDGYRAVFRDSLTGPRKSDWARAPTAPLAICLAALKAHGVALTVTGGGR